MQDVAVDAFSLKILSAKNLPYAPSFQIIGQGAGYAIAFTAYFALSKIKWGGVYFFDAQIFFFYLGLFIVLITIYIHFFVIEFPEDESN